MLDLVIKNEMKNYMLDYFKIVNTIKGQLWQIDIVKVDLYNKNFKFEHFEGILNSI